MAPSSSATSARARSARSVGGCSVTSSVPSSRALPVPISRRPSARRRHPRRSVSQPPARAPALPMRIVGGELGGRLLATPSSQAIRPSADRLRQALFDILAHSYGEILDGARVLDLFAGTGALGLEALSRGARYALFVEEAAEARG